VHIRASLDDDHDGCGCMIRRGYVNIDTLEPYILYLEHLESVELRFNAGVARAPSKMAQQMQIIGHFVLLFGFHERPIAAGLRIFAKCGNQEIFHVWPL